MEEYRKIPGLPIYYEVSNFGNVRTLDHHVKGRWGYMCLKGKTLKQCTDKKGYKFVTLEKSKTYKIHRLVAKAFISNPCNKPCIDHIDGNRKNNRAENLRWVTCKENNNNPITIKKYKERIEGKHPNSKKVYQYKKNGQLCKIYDSTKSCEKDGYNRNGVARCARGERIYYKNYIWRYEK